MTVWAPITEPLMRIPAVCKPWSWLLCACGCLFLAACAGKDVLHTPQANGGAGDTAGLPRRAVIGGMDHVLAGPVIVEYMDRQARELKRFADAVRVGDGIIVTLPAKALFKIEDTDLEPGSEALLRNITAVVNKYDETRLAVVGHTDNGGFADFDIHFSERRAKAVADDLVKLGVSRQRIRFMGMGFQSPVVGNDTAAGRARNRRIEIHIAPDRRLREEDLSPSS
ncbi:MAG: OmpA family protein [Gammaproteobacteria bacterium]